VSGTTGMEWRSFIPLQGGLQGQHVPGVIPIGGIIMWSGSVATIPSGWHICDGTNNTPDLHDRFVVAAGSGYAVGATGGDAALAAHTHTIAGGTTAGGANYAAVVSGPTSAAAHDVTTDSTGAGNSGNMPPYFALCFIQRIA
jgi:hypothetical protein